MRTQDLGPGLLLSLGIGFLSTCVLVLTLFDIARIERHDPDIAAKILELPGLTVDYEDIEEDATRVAARANEELGLDGEDGAGIQQLEVVEGGFYRNRGAYIVGRVRLGDGSVRPFIIALLNRDTGIYVDALITTAEGGSAWTILHPHYEVIKPLGRKATAPMVFAIGQFDLRMEEFLDTWITLKRANGEFDKLYKIWILGESEASKKPRWSILHDVLGVAR